MPLPTVFSHEFGLEGLTSAEATALALQGGEGTIEFYAGGNWFNGQAPTDLAHNLELYCVLSCGRASMRRESAFWTADGADPQYRGDINAFWYARYAVYLDGSSLYFQSGHTLHRLPLPADIDPSKRSVHFALVTERAGASFTTKLYVDGSQAYIIPGVGYGPDGFEDSAVALSVGGLPPGADGAVRLKGQRRTSTSPPFDVARNVKSFPGSVGGVRIWSMPYGEQVFTAVAGAPRMRRYGQFDIERTLAFPRDGLFAGLTVPQFRHLVAYSDFRGDPERHHIRLPEPLEGHWLNSLQAAPQAEPPNPAAGLTPPLVSDVPVFSIRSRSQRPDPAVRSAGRDAAFFYRDGALVGEVARDASGRLALRAADFTAQLALVGDTDRLEARCVSGDRGAFARALGRASEGVVVLERPSMRLRGTVVNGGDPFLLANRVQNTHIASFGYDLRDMDLINFDLQSGTGKMLIGEPSSRDWVLTDGGRVAPIWCHEITLERGSAGFQVDTTMSERALARRFSVRFGARQAWPSGALSVNGSYRESSSSTDFRTQVRSELSSWYQRVLLVVDPVSLVLAPEFEDAVLDLRDGRISTAQFFDTWGTHYAFSMTYGAMAMAERTMNRSELASEVSRGFDIDASLKAGVTTDASGRELSGTEVSAGGGSDKSVSKRQVFQTDATKFRTIGASVNASLDGASGNLDGAHPIQPDLRPIYELLTPVHFDDPEVYHRVRREVRVAYDRMARALAASGAASDHDDALEVIAPATKAYHLRLNSAAASDDTWIYGYVGVAPFVKSAERVPLDESDMLRAVTQGHMPYKAAYVDEETNAVRYLTDFGRSWLFRNLEDDGDFDGDNTMQVPEWTGQGHWRPFQGAASDYGIMAWTAERNPAYAAAHPDFVGQAPGELHYVIHAEREVGRDPSGRPYRVQVSAADDPQLELAIAIKLDDHRELEADEPMLAGVHVLRESDFSRKRQFLELASGRRSGSDPRATYRPGIAATRIHADQPLERIPAWFNLLIEFWAVEEDGWRSDLAARLASVEEFTPPPAIAFESDEPEVRLARVLPFGRDARARAAGAFVGGEEVPPERVLGAALVVGSDAQVLDAGALPPFGAVVRFDFQLGVDGDGFELANEGGAVVLEVRRAGVRLRFSDPASGRTRTVHLHSEPLVPGTWHELAFAIQPHRVQWAFDGRVDQRQAREIYGDVATLLPGLRAPTAARAGAPSAVEQAAYDSYRAALGAGGASLVSWSSRWACRLLDPRNSAASGRGLPTRIDEVIFAAGSPEGALELAPFLGRPRHVAATTPVRAIAELGFDAGRARDPRLPAAPRRNFVARSGARAVDGGLEVEGEADLGMLRLGAVSTVHFDVWPGARTCELETGGLAVIFAAPSEPSSPRGARVSVEVRGRRGVVQRFEAGARDLLEPRAWHKVLAQIDRDAGEVRLIVDGEVLLSGLLDGAACAALASHDAVAAIRVAGVPGSVEASGASDSAKPASSATGSVDTRAPAGARSTAAPASSPTDAGGDLPRFDELLVLAGHLDPAALEALVGRPRVVGGEAPPRTLQRPRALSEPVLSESRLRAADSSFAGRVAAYYPVDGDLGEHSGRSGAPLEGPTLDSAQPTALAAHDAPWTANLGPALDPRAFTLRCSFRIEATPRPIVGLGSFELGTEPVMIDLPNGQQRVLPIGAALVVRLRSADGVEVPHPLRFAASGKQALVPARPGAAVPPAYQAVEPGAWHELLASFDAQARRVEVALNGALLGALELPQGFAPSGADGAVLVTGRVGQPMGAQLDELLVLEGATEIASPLWRALAQRLRQE